LNWSLLKAIGASVGLYSGKFTDTQKRYSIVEKKLLAIIQALRNFKYIIGAQRVNIFTDNQNIVMNMKPTSDRAFRMVLEMPEYNYTLQHIRDTDNVIAYTL
ncbi:hypothetical protein M153_16000010641, partial [Pseudoloma neurophilia]